MSGVHPDVLSWLTQLREMNRPQEVIEHLLKEFFHQLNRNDAAVFKTFSGSMRSPLLIARLPQGVESLSESAFGLPLQGDQHNYWLAFREPLEDRASAWLELAAQLASDRLQMIELKNAKHSLERVDEQTGLLKASVFFEEVREEIKRSRRIFKPVSLLAMKLGVVLPSGSVDWKPSHTNALWRTLVKVIKRRSRSHDLMGGMGNGVIGLCLPHTDHQGGLVKAERLRRWIASAQLSPYLPSDQQGLLGVGLVEYPQACRDADELWESAFLALDRACEMKAQAVCSLEPPSGYTPDFIPVL